ncbi:hypothetical protein B0H16DRAFT_1664507 [Mycena metata]|uniref:DUF6570 domain-containing protein n=1 Tax=Mycena metata TaxID=1033252 RepID=A0AAD7ID67_9AGAR|nr:hypothetical protein B0H16DRAFT_1664507 [Mycena metata]
MIALCRAKCWIIQLREDAADDSIPFAQRGVRGHIIVYPQRPSAIAQTLPPSITDVTTPICVVFVGSKPPTSEWLREKAKPLIVRKERVLNALNWLKTHNHLYRDVVIDQTELDALPQEAVLPFHIQHVIPNTGIDVTTSDYSVVVTDVDGNAPSNELRSAALRHLRKPGSNYIEIPHDPNPANEFANPHLFPMMYPTLFPYGLGGLEDKSRRTPLGFKRHIKHLFNLADRPASFTPPDPPEGQTLQLRPHRRSVWDCVTCHCSYSR